MSNIIVLGNTKAEIANKKQAKEPTAELQEFDLVINISTLITNGITYYKFRIPNFPDTYEDREELKQMFLNLADSFHNSSDTTEPLIP